MTSPDLLQRLIFWGKAAGALSTLGGLVWGVINWFRKVSETNRNVTLLAVNHIPHLQSSLEAHGTALEGIRSDVRAVDAKVEGVNTRLEDTKKGMHTLGTAFLQHLEHVSEEEPKKKRKK